MKINIESTTMVQPQPTETEQLHILIPQEQRIYESTILKQTSSTHSVIYLFIVKRRRIRKQKKILVKT
ncbi:unnamed protein product [Rotaria sp. Silwood1]|nr:unnamed protein product [Rotaria sp. Silwood1]CAF4830394.1 unnamed protein product [Rotaria sp. Silwood1]